MATQDAAKSASAMSRGISPLVQADELRQLIHGSSSRRQPAVQGVDQCPYAQHGDHRPPSGTGPYVVLSMLRLGERRLGPTIPHQRRRSGR